MIQSSLARGIVGSLATRGAVTALALITTILVTRALGPDGRGLFALATTLGALGIQLGNLGLHASNTYAVARNRQHGPALVGNSLLISAMVGTAIGLVIVLMKAVLPDVIRIDAQLTLLAVASIPVGLAYLLVQNLLLGIEDIRSFNALEVGQRLGLLVLSGGAIAAGLASPQIFLVVGLVVVSTTAVIATRRLARIFGTIRVDWQVAIGSVSYGLRAYAAALLAYVVLRIDLLMVGWLRGPADAGHYSVAVALADFVYMPATVAGMLLFPRLVRSEPAARRTLAVRAAAIVGAATAGLAVIASAGAYPAVSLLFGTEFLPAVEPFIVLLPAVTALATNTILMTYFAAMGMPMFTVYSPGTAALLNVVLNLVLIPQLGPTGAALASVAAYAVMLILSVMYLSRNRNRAVRAEGPTDD